MTKDHVGGWTDTDGSTNERDSMAQFTREGDDGQIRNYGIGRDAGGHDLVTITM